MNETRRLADARRADEEMKSDTPVVIPLGEAYHIKDLHRQGRCVSEGRPEEHMALDLWKAAKPCVRNLAAAWGATELIYIRPPLEPSTAPGACCMLTSGPRALGPSLSLCLSLLMAVDLLDRPASSPTLGSADRDG